MTTDRWWTRKAYSERLQREAALVASIEAFLAEQAGESDEDA